MTKPLTDKNDSITMAAPKGNQFWKQRAKHGRDKLFASSECLWEACCEYFEWVQANPMEEERIFCYQGEIIQGSIKRIRPMTLSSLFIFLDISKATWSNWKNGDNKGLMNIIERAEMVIYTQKFEGAATNLFNANLMARELGIKDRVETEELVRPIVQISAEEYLRAREQILAEDI